MTLSFVPTTISDALSWREAGQASAPVAAHQVSAGYLEAFGIDASSADDQETAEFGALYLASLSCLLQRPERFVLVVDTTSNWTDSSGADAEFGLGELAGFRWSEVTAFYVDEPAAQADVAAAHLAIAGKSLTDAWEDDAVVSLLATYTLLWHDVAELPWAQQH